MQKVKEVTVATISDGKVTDVTTEYVPVPVIRTIYGSHMFPKKYEFNDGKSLTVPNDAISIQDLMDRYAHGMPLGGSMDDFRTDEDGNTPDGLPDMRNLDLAEREEVLRQVAEKRDEIIATIRKNKDAAAKARLDNLVNARLKEKADKRAEFEKLKKELEDE